MAYLAIESQHLTNRLTLVARTQCRPEIYRVIIEARIVGR
jgi:hypothetical protein